MAAVWDLSKAAGTDRLVLLAIADSADHDGANAWPSIATVARKCLVSERTVQRAIRNLVALGELEVEDQAGGNAQSRADRRPNRYRVVLDGVSDRHPAANGVTSEAERGDTQGANGVTRVSPEPSSDPSMDPSFVVSDDVRRLCDLLAELMVANGCRPPSITKTGWYDPIRLLIEKDGISPDRVERAIRWCQADEFWRANIHSGKALREKFDTLRQQAARPKPGSVAAVRDAREEYLARKAAG